VTGLVLLSVVAWLWFCYVTLGVMVAVLGPHSVPSLLVRLFEPIHKPPSFVRGMGVGAGTVVSLFVAILPEAALVREMATGRTTSVEGAAILLGAIACVLWLAFLVWRHFSTSDAV
jgi:hypothetical protein